MLVMRNFGFLGLHTAIHSHSKLARDRLVDFTGEIQVRRRNDEDISDRDVSQVCHHSADVWHQDFVGEPVENGGRNMISFQNDSTIPLDTVNSKSKLYAKELVPIPLSLSWSNTRSMKVPYNGLIDAGIPFHTSFCNELLCQPLLLQNSSKRNITVKVEIRKLNFCGERKLYIASSLRSGPAIHNNRRGPFLVYEAYTSCAYHTVDPHFLDEFKIKLPFNLTEGLSDMSADDANDGKLIILFSVYNVSVKAKKKWSLISKQKGPKHDGEDNSNENCELNSISPFPQDLLGCGFLPLCPKNDSTCLISDGKHDVKLKYLSRPEVCSSRQSEDGLIGKDGSDFAPESLILEPIDPLALVEKESIHGTNLFPEIWDQSTAKSANELLADVDDILQQTSDRFHDGSIPDHMRSENDVPPPGHLSTPSSISSLSAATDSVSSRKKKDREIIHHLRKTSRLNEVMILKVS